MGLYRRVGSRGEGDGRIDFLVDVFVNFSLCKSLSFCILVWRVLIVSLVRIWTFLNSFSDFSLSFFLSMLTNPWPLSKGVII